MLSRVWCSRALMLAAVLATLTGARSMLLVERLVPASCSSHSHGGLCWSVTHTHHQQGPHQIRLLLCIEID